MPRRISALCGLIILCCGIAHADGLRCYEHWMDNDVSNRRVVKSSAEDIAISLDLGSLPEGVHYFNFRAQDSEMVWGALNRYLFYIPTRQSATPTLNGYEYWLDNDVAGRTVKNSSDTELALNIDVSSLTEGVHFFNFRSFNDDGLCGALERYLFFIPAAANPNATFSSYSYWIDNDVASAKNVAASGDEIIITEDVSSLSDGVHFFNFRPRNSDGICGALERYLFYKPAMANPNATLSCYEYWMDNDLDHRTVVKNTSEDVMITVDIKDLPSGVHYFNYRACNSDGIWGAMQRYIFYKTDETAGISPLCGYEYTFGALETSVDITPTDEYEIDDMVIPIPALVDCSPIDASCKFTFSKEAVVMDRQTALPFSIRFRDQADRWSASVVQSINMSDKIEHTPERLGVQKSIEFDKVAIGDYYPFYINVPETGSYYFKASQPCTIDLYNADGTLYRTMTADELLKIKQIGLFAGTYYGIVHATVTNELYPAKSVIVRMLLTEGYVPTPVITYADGIATITCEQEGSKIYYTTDGTDPTVQSAVYTKPIEVTTNLTIKAMATYEDLSPSDICVYKVDVYKVATPVIEFANLKLYMTCSTPSSTIYYTLDGSDPVTNGIKYTSAVSVSKSCTAKAVAKRDGYNDSDITTYVFDDSEVTCATPVITFSGGEVTISCIQDGSKIYYTTDGSEPSAKSALYSGAFKVDENCTVKAIAACDGFLNSPVAEYIIDTYKVETPEIRFANLQVHIACGTPKSEIYYTLDGSDPADSGVLYSAPISVDTDCIVKAMAKRANYHNSEIAVYAVNTQNFTCPAPVFTLSGNSLAIECFEDGSNIHYTMDGSEPSAASPVYTSPIALVHNCVVKAYAAKSGLYDSETVSYTVDWIKAETPTFTLSGETLSIECSTPGAEIYFTIGGETPDQSSLRYLEPVRLEDNRVIKAIAYAKDYNPSNMAEFKPDVFVCAEVTISYDGRYVALSTTESGAEVHYTLDGSTPDKYSPEYSGRIDVGGLVTVKAIASKEYFANSAAAVYDVTYYYDGDKALTSEGGVLAKAFGWCGTGNLTTLSVTGVMDAADMGFTASVSSLKHLDIENVTTPDGNLPDKAFANSALVSVTMPKAVGKVGDAIFEGSRRLAAIDWIATKALPASALTGIDNPNLLLYVKIKSLAPSVVKNVIASDVAESIVLVDGDHDFFCPREFTAKTISYTHRYTMKTPIHGCAGWETIALPFDVQTATHSVNGEIAPFAAHIDDAKPYWLYELGAHGFSPAQQIAAYTPYVISMPNNDEYDDNYILAGDVTFKAKDAIVAPTTANVAVKGDFVFIPTTAVVAKDQNVYAINKDEAYDGQSPGSMFVGDLRAVSPFEGYLAIDEGTSRQRIIRLSDLGLGNAEESGLSLPTKDSSLNIRVADGRLYIETGIDRSIAVYTMQGMLVRILDLRAGLNIVDDLPEGLYIVGSKPVMIK